MPFVVAAGHRDGHLIGGAGLIEVLKRLFKRTIRITLTDIVYSLASVQRGAPAIIRRVLCGSRRRGFHAQKALAIRILIIAVIVDLVGCSIVVDLHADTLTLGARLGGDQDRAVAAAI